MGGVLEIGFVEENPLVFHFHELGERLTVQVDDIFIIPPNHRLEVSTLHPGEHKHTSVEFLIDCTTECLRQKTLSAQDCESIRGQTVILPYVIPASKENAELIALIRQLARDQMLMVERTTLRSAWPACGFWPSSPRACAKAPAMTRSRLLTTGIVRRPRSIFPSTWRSTSP